MSYEQSDLITKCAFDHVPCCYIYQRIWRQLFSSKDKVFGRTRWTDHTSCRETRKLRISTQPRPPRYAQSACFLSLTTQYYITLWFGQNEIPGPPLQVTLLCKSIIGNLSCLRKRDGQIGQVPYTPFCACATYQMWGPISAWLMEDGGDP